MKKDSHFSIYLSRRKFIKYSSLIAGTPLVLTEFNQNYPGKSEADQNLSIRYQGNEILLESSFMILNLDTKNGLKANWWQNKITGKKIQLGEGSEFSFTVGLPGGTLLEPALTLVKKPEKGDHKEKVVFELFASDIKARINLEYRIDRIYPVLTKSAVIVNESNIEWNRLLDIQLGDYKSDARKIQDKDWPVLLTRIPWSNAEPDYWKEPAGKTRGFPTYLEDQYFIGIDHPSGFSITTDDKTEIRHHPGIKLPAGKSFQTFNAVYGVTEEGKARTGFRAYLHSKMRRVLRGHDHAYAIIDTCGAQNNTNEDYFKVSETWCLEHIDKMAQAEKETGLHFDNYVIEFWHDSTGDLKECDPKRFPDNFDKIIAKLSELGVNLGVWISSGEDAVGKNLDNWTIGDNPVLFPTGTDGNGKGRICRSTSPANQMYIDGLSYQIEHNKVRQIKLDVGGDLSTEPFDPRCENPEHQHLPGELYSVEANHNAQIDLLSALDKKNPETFFTLYWGHYSPWWLLHADTVYDIGERMEMASHSFQPALFARSSNIRRTDQAKRMTKDIPHLGWDSLGISLSDWAWNNRLGTEKWLDAVLMEICRGSLLLHIWSDNDCIPKNDRPQLSAFIKLLKANTTCFKNPVSIGNPFKDDYWGYCCSDGSKAMIGIYNGSWKDQTLSLSLDKNWGLKDNKNWNIYSWYPDRIKFQNTSGSQNFRSGDVISIRPFTALLLEVIPIDQLPSLENNWKTDKIPVQFQEKNISLETSLTENRDANGYHFKVSGHLPETKEGWLAVTFEYSRNGQPFLSLNNKPLALSAIMGPDPVDFEAVLDNPWYPAPWQTYRHFIKSNSSAKEFVLSGTVQLPSDVQVITKGYFIPVR